MLKLFNFFVLQWFCIRLVRCTRKVYTYNKGTTCSNEYYISQWYSLAGWIVPFTGWWWNDYNIRYHTFGRAVRCGDTFPWMKRITWRRKMDIYNSKQV